MRVRLRRPPLAGIVAGRAGARDLLVHRSDVDDLALAARGLARADEVLTTVERAVQVGPQLVVPVLERYLGDVLAGGIDARVVDQDVRRAELALRRPFSTRCMARTDLRLCQLFVKRDGNPFYCII